MLKIGRKDMGVSLCKTGDREIARVFVSLRIDILSKLYACLAD